MRQAGSTTAGELSTKCFPGAVEAHSSVTGCDAGLCCKVPDTKAIQVHPADCRPVLRLEGLDQAQHAVADHPLKLPVRSVGIFGFGGEPIECTALTILPPVMVGDGIPKNAVEPGSRRARASKGRSMVEASDECFLKNVFCFVAGAHTPFQECQKACMVIQQYFQHLRCCRVALG